MTDDVDIQRLTKLMMMTTSNFDAEALVAIRKANSMISACKKNWQDILSFTQTRSFSYGPRPKKRKKSTPEQKEDPRSQFIDEMFKTLLETVSVTSSFREFIDSVHAQWIKTRRLTDKQYDAIHRAYLKSKPENTESEVS